MSYSDEWLEEILKRRQWKDRPVPVEPVLTESTTWRPWAEMTAAERRKALDERDKAK